MVSVSPQSAASLAVHFQLTLVDTAQKLTSFLKQMGRWGESLPEDHCFGLVCPGCWFHLCGSLIVSPAGVHSVFDTAFSRNFSLLESQREFVQRFRHQTLPVLASACPGVCWLQRAVGRVGGRCPWAGADGQVRARRPSSHRANAGWICYAEKAHGSFLLPYLSTVRSPQQVMGALLKDFFAQQQVTVQEGLAGLPSAVTGPWPSRMCVSPTARGPRPGLPCLGDAML